MVQFDEDQRVLDFLIDNGLASLKGQADVAVALGAYTRPRIALEPSFPQHGLSKLSRRILRDSSTSTSGTRATRAHSLDLLYNPRPETNTHGHTRHIVKRAQQDSRTVECPFLRGPRYAPEAFIGYCDSGIVGITEK